MSRLPRSGVALLRSPELGPLLGLVFLTAVFAAFSGGDLFTTQSLLSVTGLAAGVGLTGLGVTMLMISGEFDLSVSATFSTAPIVMGILVTDYGWPVTAALVAGILAVLFIGLLNGLITVFTGVQSFIVTLAMLFTIVMIERIIRPQFAVQWLTTGEVRDILGGRIEGTPFTAPFIWMFALMVVLWLLLQHTRFGNWTYAAGYRGGDIARAMGVPVKRVKVANFMLCAGLTGLAGCFQYANFGLTSLTSGVDYNLYAIVAAAIGGTSLFGARGTVIGTAIGAVMLGTVNVGLILVGTSGEYYIGATGLLLIAAAVINARLAKTGTGGLAAGWRVVAEVLGRRPV